MEFNPTAGIPKTSFNEKSSPSFNNATWFSTVQPTLRTLCPNKGNKMNDMAVNMDTVTVSGKHFIVTTDPVTGEEIRIEVSPTGEFSQEVEDEAVTLH